MRVHDTALDGVRIVEPHAADDGRGRFVELFRSADYEAAGLPAHFERDYLSVSHRGVVRGLHFQNPSPHVKLVTVVRGRSLAVAVDLRRGSLTFAGHVAVELDARRPRQLFIPAGFAFAYAALEDDTTMHYKCNGAWAPQHEHRIRWDDPELAIPWPLSDPILSDKDAAGVRLRDIPPDALFP